MEVHTYVSVQSMMINKYDNTQISITKAMIQIYGTHYCIIFRA